MNRFRSFFCGLLLLVLLPLAAPAQTDPAGGSPPNQLSEEEKTRVNAAAAAAAGHVKATQREPDLLEDVVDSTLARFDIRSGENTPTHYAIAALFVVVAFVLRRAVILFLFAILKRLASRTKSTLDDKLFVAVERPLVTFIVVLGLVCALKVLKLSPAGDNAADYGATIAFSFVLFWFLLRAFNTLLDHAHEVATAKHLGISAFMPWIKKTLLVVFTIFGVLMVAQSLGADVKAFLAGLGIGGLAFALAAQDTLANVFGSVVVAIDQPFKVGEFIQVGGNSGTVEDIGLRSTKLRTPGKSLVIIPNKIVAAEAITNLSRFTQRRVEQTLGLTYDTKPEQMEAIVEEIRQIILREEGVEKPSVIVQFTELADSSLNIWLAYNTVDPDFVKHLQLKQRVNLAVMRAVAARGLAFAFPTRTIELGGTLAKEWVKRG